MPKESTPTKSADRKIMDFIATFGHYISKDESSTIRGTPTKHDKALFEKAEKVLMVGKTRQTEGHSYETISSYFLLAWTAARSTHAKGPSLFLWRWITWLLKGTFTQDQQNPIRRPPHGHLVRCTLP
jgi:hypothetical protein